MESWEYKSLMCDGPTMETTLAALGEQGWEAVGFAPALHNGASIKPVGGAFMVTEWTAGQYRVLLKRCKP